MALRQWIKNNKFDKSNEFCENVSHTTFDGQKYYVPNKFYSEFLLYYSKDLELGTKLYVIEARPYIFKFMIDFDITDDHYWTDEEVIEISKISNEVIHKYLKNTYVSIICKTTGPKLKGTKIHTGIHVIYPKLFVCSETARTLRNAILLILNDLEAIKNRLNTIITNFSECLDERIYIKNGFRMIGSDKLKDSEPENRTYWPICVLNSEGSFLQSYYSELKNNMYISVCETSTRFVPEYVYYNTPNGVDIIKPTWFKELPDPIYQKKVQKGILHLNSDIISLMNNFINNMGIYGHDVVQDIISANGYSNTGDQDVFFVKVRSKYCCNILKKHNSCGIYFIIFNHTLFQRCYCLCDNLSGRLHGYCKEYQSEGYYLPDNIYNAIHPPIVFLELKDSENDSLPVTDMDISEKAITEDVFLETVIKVAQRPETINTIKETKNTKIEKNKTKKNNIKTVDKTMNYLKDHGLFELD